MSKRAFFFLSIINIRDLLKHMKKNRKNYKIEYLRALSCIGVLLYHLDILKSGYLAVCCFFVLSGYLSIPVAVKTQKAGDPSLLCEPSFQDISADGSLRVFGDRCTGGIFDLLSQPESGKRIGPIRLQQLLADQCITGLFHKGQCLSLPSDVVYRHSLTIRSVTGDLLFLRRQIS